MRLSRKRLERNIRMRKIWWRLLYRVNRRGTWEISRGRNSHKKIRKERRFQERQKKSTQVKFHTESDLKMSFGFSKSKKWFWLLKTVCIEYKRICRGKQMEERLKIWKRKSDAMTSLNETNGMWIRAAGAISLSSRKNTFSTEKERSTEFWGKKMREVFTWWFLFTPWRSGESIA